MTDERLEIAKRIMKAMRFDVARSTLMANPDGPRQIVVGLATDTLEETAERVDAVGGYATVVVPVPSGQLVTFGWCGRPTEIGLDLGESEPLHPISELGLLVEYLRASTGDAPLHFRLSRESVDVVKGDVITAPI